MAQIGKLVRRYTVVPLDEPIEPINQPPLPSPPNKTPANPIPVTKTEPTPAG